MGEAIPAFISGPQNITQKLCGQNVEFFNVKAGFIGLTAKCMREFK
jgi:hypothetical protein